MELDPPHLTQRTTYEDAVRDNMFEGREFGHCNEDWERLKAKMVDGDEFWYFEPPSRTSLQHWGLALLRRGRVVSTVITAVD